MLMLDTHIAVALFEGRLGGLGLKARRALDAEPACISPAVLLELELLHEIGRLRFGGRTVAGYLDASLDIGLARESFAEIAANALDFGFTRDPFDRLIVAHAALRKATLVTTRDETLRHYYPNTLG